MILNKKQEILKKRVLKHANLFLKRGETIRTVAQKTGWSKSTVNNDLNKRLSNINFNLYIKVIEKLAFNKNAAPYRGGEARKNKGGNNEN